MNSLLVSTSHVLLGLLSGGPLHGYDLKRAHDSALPKAKPLAFGQVYATLGRLERDGLVCRSGSEQVAGPERTAFALTGQGREHLREWLSEVEPAAPFVTSALLAKVVVALLTAGEVVAREYLIRQRATHAERLRELTRAKTDPDTTIGAVIAADFAIAHIDADLRWLETTLARVSEARVSEARVSELGRAEPDPGEPHPASPPASEPRPLGPHQEVTS